MRSLDSGYDTTLVGFNANLLAFGRRAAAESWLGKFPQRCTYIRAQRSIHPWQRCSEGDANNDNTLVLLLIDLIEFARVQKRGQSYTCVVEA